MEQIFLPLHLISLAYVAWNIFHADHMGFDWMRGKVATLDVSRVRKYHHGSWIGLGLMIATGFALFWPLREFLLTRPEFYVKMAFVITLICNGFVIGKLQNTATTKTFASLSATEKLPLIISGAVSTISWVGAAIMAFFLLPY
jgi:hypothetical protein